MTVFEALRDLRDRLRARAETLSEMSASHDGEDRARLSGKAEGVRLALSYVEEFPGARFVLDPYGEFGPNNDDANDRSDAEKLRLLADWFDMKDDREGVPESNREVQADLRRIADYIGDIS